jgi:hypothetical protein
MREAVIHLLQRVDDEVDRRAQRFGDRQFAVEPVLGGGPEFDAVGEPVVVDDDQQVEVRLVAFGGMGLIDPSAARIAAVENDLEDAPLLLPVRGRNGGRVAEFLEQDLDDTLKLALLGWRQMIEAGPHGSILTR